MKIKAIILTLLFDLAIIAFAIGIRFSPMWTMFLFILIIVSLMVMSVLSAYEAGNNNEQILTTEITEPQLKNAKKLLRYSTAVMAFLSWTTTATGMEGYVFTDAWKSYLASFGVQSVLVVLSLLLCRFFMAIGQTGWPKYLRKILRMTLVLFLALFMVVSSVFSFACIANNAYEETWASDRETMVRAYFLTEAYSLKEENSRRGNLILNQIETIAKGNLQEQLTNINDENLKLTIEEVNSYLSAIDATAYSGSVYYDVSRLEVSEASEAESTSLSEAYQGYIDTYNTAVSEYNSNRSILAGEALSEDAEESDLQAIRMKIQAQKTELGNAISNLTSLVETIDELRTSYYYNDFAPVRNIFKTGANALIVEIESYIDSLDEILDTIDDYENDTSITYTQSSDSITKRIYALEISDAKEEDAKELAEYIADILAMVIEDEHYEATDVSAFVDLNRLIQDYIVYLELDEAVEVFIEDSASTTYQISVSDVLVGAEVSEEDWSEIRESDFNTLIECVNGLPDVTEIDGEPGSYVQSTVLNEAAEIQRDFFGNLTDFEQAFNYFKYDYKMMAYFSAFMAVFLDLSAFWVGCFLFFTDAFKESSGKREQKSGTRESAGNSNSNSLNISDEQV